MKTNKITDNSFAVFLAVGFVNTVISAVVMLVLEDLGYWFSTAIAYIAGGIISYFLNRYITFKSRETTARSVVKFVINAVICYVLAYSFAKPVASLIISDTIIPNIWKERFAKLAGMGIYTLLNYLGQKNFAFKKR